MTETWSAAETLALKRMVNDGLNAEQCSREFRAAGIERTHQAVRRKVQREAKRDPLGWRALVRPGSTERFDKQVCVHVDRALLLFDIHAPFHDEGWINEAVGVALQRGCNTVCIGGDLVDFSAFSKWGRQERVEAEDEIKSAEQVVSALARNFATVVYSGGNHENRLPRKTDNLLTLQAAMEMFVSAPNVTITDYHWLEIVSGGERFYVEHPKNYSLHATLVPKALCSKYLCHVIAGHGHGWGMTRDTSGRFWAIDAGMCADPMKLAYQMKVHNRNPVMQQGAVLIEEGVPLLLSPHNIRVLK